MDRSATSRRSAHPVKGSWARLPVHARIRSAAMRWSGVFSSLGAVAVLVLLVADSGWRALLLPLAGADLEWVALALGLALAVEVVKTVRWQLLLGIGPRSLPGLLALVLGARLLNAFAPLRAGDFWRVASVTKLGRRPLSLVGGSVVVEKLLDATALGAGSLFLTPPGLLDQPPTLFWVAAFLGLLALVAGLAPQLGRWPEAARTLSGLAQLWNGRQLLGAAMLTPPALGLGLLVNLAVLQALGFPGGIAAGVVMLVSAYAAGLIPAAPGQLGVFELAVSASLMAIGATPASSLAAAVVLHLVILGTIALGGLLTLPLGLLAERIKGPGQSD